MVSYQIGFPAKPLNGGSMSDPVPNSSSAPSAPPGSQEDLQVLERNVRALVEHAAEHERTRSTSDRIAGAISGFAGSLNFIYFHIVAYGFWAAVDLGWVPWIRPFDPTFTILGSTAAVEAIFLTTFVLLAQNRMAERADLRNHLDIQVGLLTERETTHILRLVAAMSERMGIDLPQDPELQELLRDVAPKEVLDRIEVQTEAVEQEGRTNLETE